VETYLFEFSIVAL